MILRLTPSERTVLRLLSRRLAVSNEQFLDALYGGRPECEWISDPLKTVQVLICRMRKKLRWYGVEIVTHHACDKLAAQYALTPASREMARFIVENYLALITGNIQIPCEVEDYVI